MSWIAVGISAASFLSGAASSESAAKSSRKQARIKSDYLTQQMAKADESLAALEPVKESKLKVAEASYLQDIGDLSAQTGQVKKTCRVSFNQ